MSTSNGKGDRDRTSDHKKYRKNMERIRRSERKRKARERGYE